MNLKYISVLCFLAGATAYGQVKTNQPTTIDPKSNTFLDASENTESQLPSIGKGLLFPQTDLSTFKLDVNAADGINYPTYFDGMIVYNTKEGGKTSDTNIQVTDNLQKGFYYFSNPTGKTTGNITNGKWIKLSDTQANDQLWAQRDNNGITETYLKPALGQGDFVGYQKARKYLYNLGNVAEGDLIHQYLNNATGYVSNEIPFATLVSSDVLPQTSSIAAGNGFYFTSNQALLKEAHVASNPSKTYQLDESRLVIKDVTSPIGGLTGVNSSVDMFSNTTASGISGISGITSVGSQNGNYSRATVSSNTGGVFHARNYGTSTDMYGTRTFVSNRGVADNIRGSYINISSQVLNIGQASMPAHTVKVLYGVDNVVNVSENATVETGTNGIRSASYFRENSTNPVHYGIFNYNRTYAGANVDKLYGARYFFVNDATATIGEMYGLYIDNVNKGTTKNYAIYTGLGTVRFGDNVGIGVDTPVEKLEVAGKVKATAFIGTNGAAIFPDYVFQKYYTGTSSIKADYSFKTLSQVENFVKANGHLPGYQSAAEIKKQGYIDIMATQLTNVEKIEELYLHSIEQEKKIEAQQKQIEELKSLVQQLLNK
ncbi:hypothetical protein [Riemerella anatipestifer]|uniref:Uncharacterized protein n=1 Tax=Riemerella anatipestifer TaxID=34085 RepID=A0AAP6LMH5_RIEAN|nr:hypothetical protein [Riemerella anatipestifer]MCD5969108.1 hypothetical protein [Riemerella anatipestifer]MCO7355653.1 hypothetical protein [Riemerella anatipestifer]MCU7541103.1 hypothetical protein [Riemerella anatipestifer]MCU7571239.1 hypothetical protein [Riemerella anatipestifer]MCU7598042.1 hypothetical protein [Riemerella anatipestifer]